jgi:hypothetical protein
VSASAHLGTKNVDSKMQQYVWRRRHDGLQILDVSKTWEKIQLAARIIVTIEAPGDVIAISARPYAQRAVLKFAAHTGAQSIAGRYTPGTFTNQITKQFKEPRVLIVTDPRVDHQPIREVRRSAGAAGVGRERWRGAAAAATPITPHRGLLLRASPSLRSPFAGVFCQHPRHRLLRLGLAAAARRLCHPGQQQGA